MKTVPSSSLRVRLLVFVVLAMVPVIGLEVNTRFQQRRQAAEDSASEALRLANLVAVTQRDLLIQMEEFLATVALLPSMQQADVEACTQTLAGLLDLHPYTANVGLIDLEGNLICSALPFTPPVTLADRAYFQRAVQNQGFAVGDYQIGRVTKISSINVAFPVKDSDGDLLGVVFAAIDLDWFNHLAAEAELPEGSTVTLVDPRGIIVARYPDADERISQSIADTALFTAILEQPGKGVVEVEGLDSINRLYGYIPLLEVDGEDPYLIVGIPTSVVFAGANRSFSQNMIGMTVIVIFGLIAAWLGSEAFLLRDVRKLVDAARKLASGRLKTRADPSSATSELSELAQTFNVMAESLENRIEELERADDRLRRINRSLSVLSASNQAVVRSKDESDLLSRICEILIDVGRYRCVWIGFIDSEKEPSLHLVEQRGFSRDPIDSLTLAQAELEKGEGFTYEAIRTGKPVIARDVLHTSEFSVWNEEAISYGYHSFAVVPLEGEHHSILGTLNLFAEEEDTFSKDELELLDELASDLSYGVFSRRSEIRRKQAAEALRQLIEFNENIIQSVSEGIVLEDEDGVITFANSAAARILGYDPEELLGLPSTTVVSPDQLGIVQVMSERRREGITDQYELELIRKDGTKIVTLVNASPRVETGRFGGSLLAFADITELRTEQTKAQLRERLAVVGELAAGIAHDFNNILGAIILYSELLLKQSTLLDDDQNKLMTIVQQAKRGAELVGQILDFSRKAIVERRILDLSRSLTELKPLLDRTMPESIEIEIQVEEGPFTINADPTRIQQVVMNLAVNARDAMPGGGVLRFELNRLRVFPGKPPYRDMKPGEWVRLKIADSGSGIPDDVMPHIFEPFFTTKSAGEGTGLGLAQVYGIVKRHDGYIDVASKVGRGTMFTIYFPYLEKDPAIDGLEEGDKPLAGMGRTIMLVEDDPAVKEATAEILHSLNFRVVEASSGKEAIDILAKGQRSIDLVLSDLVMPDMGGRELYEAIREGYPGIKMILMTGYPLRNGTRELLERHKVAWINKPFTGEDLSRAILQVLG